MMVSSSSFLRIISTTALLFTTTHSLAIPDDPSPPPAASARPLYAIAHKVLDQAGVDAAIKHGANALEMDMTAWKEGWWCDHDGTKNSWHASTGDQFNHIASKKTGGANLQWVWLDIKNPDWCDLDDPKWEVCSIKGLQKLARDILEPVGVRVLYGFMKEGKAFSYVQGNLNENEAFNYDGSPDKTPRQVSADYGSVSKDQKVASYGDDDLTKGFGNCTEDSWYTCTELRIAEASGNWGKVFGWTVAEGQTGLSNDMFSKAHVDGTIYGHASDIYADVEWAQAASKIVLDWIHNNAGNKVADSGNPWS